MQWLSEGVTAANQYEQAELGKTEISLMHFSVRCFLSRENIQLYNGKIPNAVFKLVALFPPFIAQASWLEAERRWSKLYDQAQGVCRWHEPKYHSQLPW